MDCKICKQLCIRKGIRNNVQQYYCKLCRKYQRAMYVRKVLNHTDKRLLIQLNNEGVGVKSIGRILTISGSSVLKHLKQSAGQINKPLSEEEGYTYEIDEMQTYIGSNTEQNRVYIMYCINRTTREVIDFIVGRRTKENLNHLIKTVMERKPRKIYTDRLNIYRSIIEKRLHCTCIYGTNHIERMNLTLRIHLKRLNRKTICFSKSITMLVACLKIYFWG